MLVETVRKLLAKGLFRQASTGARRGVVRLGHQAHPACQSVECTRLATGHVVEGGRDAGARHGARRHETGHCSQCGWGR